MPTSTDRRPGNRRTNTRASQERSKRRTKRQSGSKKPVARKTDYEYSDTYDSYYSEAIDGDSEKEGRILQTQFFLSSKNFQLGMMNFILEAFLDKFQLPVPTESQPPATATHGGTQIRREHRFFYRGVPHNKKAQYLDFKQSKTQIFINLPGDHPRRCVLKAGQCVFPKGSSEQKAALASEISCLWLRRNTGGEFTLDPSVWGPANYKSTYESLQWNSNGEPKVVIPEFYTFDIRSWDSRLGVWKHKALDKRLQEPGNGHILFMNIASQAEQNLFCMSLKQFAFLSSCMPMHPLENIQDSDQNHHPTKENQYAIDPTFILQFAESFDSIGDMSRLIFFPEEESLKSGSRGRLQLDFHLRYIKPIEKSWLSTERKGVRVHLKFSDELEKIRNGLILNREIAPVGQNTGNYIAERAISISTTILLNTHNPYSMVILSDDWLPMKDFSPYHRLRDSETGIGITQFMSMISFVFETAEEGWLSTLDTIDSLLQVSLGDFLDSERLNGLMFDQSFRRSKDYFSSLQILRFIRDRIEDNMENLRDLEQVYYDVILKKNEIFDSSFDCDDIDKNWELLLKRIQSRSDKILRRINVMSEEIKGLRDGLFNATALKETNAAAALNKAIYVFTVITVLYTPIGFLATFFALPFLNNPTDDKVREPTGFRTSFIVVPLLTYLIALITAWSTSIKKQPLLKENMSIRWYLLGKYEKVSLWKRLLLLLFLPVLLFIKLFSKSKNHSSTRRTGEMELENGFHSHE